MKNIRDSVHTKDHKMVKYLGYQYIIPVILMIASMLNARSQTFYIKENFSNATGLTPPQGWKTYRLSGGSAEGFRFDNPTGKQLGYPLQMPTAIFDAAASPLLGSSQIVTLESPDIDLSGTTKLLLSFDHQYIAGNDAIGVVQVWANNVWTEVVTYATTMSSGQTVTIDISSEMAGKNPTKIRFLWSGKQNGSWAIDNVKLYAPLPVDAGISAIDNPSDPFGEGKSEISVSLLNYGSTQLTSANIKWTVNGIPQKDMPWKGNLAFASQQNGLELGQFDMRAGVPYHFKIWTENPNGQFDDNPSNDTIVRTLIPSLCGTYTIGGNNPNFPTITRAVEFLHSAGIGCPVVMKIRDGVYNEQLEMKIVRGASSINTITFEGEKGDSAKAHLTSDMNVTSYRYTINLNGARHVRFKHMEFSKRGDASFHSVSVTGKSFDIVVDSCKFNKIKERSGSMYISDEADSIYITNSMLTGFAHFWDGNTGINADNKGSVIIKKNSFLSSFSAGINANIYNIDINENYFENCWTGISVRSKDKSIIKNNTLNDTQRGIYIYGLGKFNVSENLILFKRDVGIYSEASNAEIINNRIDNKKDDELKSLYGIQIAGSSESRVLFNTVKMMRGNSNAAAIAVNKIDSLLVNSNIFFMNEDGHPFLILGKPQKLTLDRNNYFSSKGFIGRIDGKTIKTFDNWKSLINGELNGYATNPGFLNDSSYTPTLIYLNGKGLPNSGITNDFDGKLRNPINPDIGSAEFDLCTSDAAIEAITEPTAPINMGKNDIKALIRNNGNSIVNTLSIAWSVNGIRQKDTVWNGSLPYGNYLTLKIGSFDFTEVRTGYEIKAWIISQPSDCHKLNDTAKSDKLYGRLCGTYTIGGINPDFKSFNEAVIPLLSSGVSCPVTFKIRNGTYNEQVRIDSIPGTTSINRVTFESENNDSSAVILNNNLFENRLIYTMNLSGTRHISINKITIQKDGGSETSGLLIDGNAYDIKVNACEFATKTGNAANILINDNSDSVIVSKSTFSGASNWDISIGIMSRNYVSIDENSFLSRRYISIYGQTGKVNVSNNFIYNSMFGIHMGCYGDASISGNKFKLTDVGIHVGGHGKINITGNNIDFNKSYGISADGTNSIISNNWIYDLSNKESNSTVGILIKNPINTQVLFNSIHMLNGTKQSSAIKVESGDTLLLSSNIFSIPKFGYPVIIDAAPRRMQIDRNSYQSPFGWIGLYEKSHFTNIAAWRVKTQGEANGLVANPFFSNDSTLTPRQILLNSTGMSGSNVTTDYFKVARSTSTPDIGAVEFDPCQTDAGLLSLLEPGLPLDIGLKNLKLVLQNNGQSTITQARISWTVNGSPIKDTLWQGILAMGATDTMIVGKFDFKPLTEYEVKAWIDLMSPMDDCLKANDTLISQKLYGRLCGSYTIGGINPDFKTFNDAVNFLSFAGISCPVVFKIRDGVYDEKIIIDSVMGASSFNTITFESESRDSSKVMITRVRSYTDPIKPTISIRNAKNIRFRHFNIAQIGWDPGNPIVSVSGNSKDIQFHRMQFTERQEGGNSVVISDNSDSIIIQNSAFRGHSDHGIYMTTNGMVFVRDNKFGRSHRDGRFILGQAGKFFMHRNRMDSCIRGIEVSILDTAAIVENVINEISLGMILTGNAKYHVEANRINFTNGTAIIANGLKNSRIANNWVYNNKQLSTNGMLLTNCTDTRVLFNTVNITGNNNNSSAIAIERGSNISVFNNVLRNASGGYCMKLVGGTVNLSSDYNCYYAPLNNIGSLDDKIYNKLSLWGNLINGESNSLFINPFFRSNTEYRPNHILLNDAGITINPITRDIDTALRHPVSPDIGVKEFTPCNNDAGINEFSSPALPIGEGKQEIKVILQNQGLGTINSVRIQWSINGAIQPAFEWTGTLPTRKNTEVRIGSFDFIAGPEWTIRAWTTNPNGINDCNFFNDTTVLFVAGTPNSVPFPPTARDTTVCRGNSVTLKASGVGKIGWYTAPVGGTWLGGDTLYTTPTLTANTTYYVQDSVTTASLARTAVNVIVFNPPPFDALPDMIYSRADSLPIRPDSTLRPTKHLWSTGDTTDIIHVKYTGGYRVHFNTPNGCRLTDSVFVRFPDTLGINIDTTIGSCTLPVEVPVTVSGFRRISRFGGQISWDTAQLRVNAVILQPTSSPILNPSDFNSIISPDGKLDFEWKANVAKWKSLPDSFVIFKIRFTPHTSLIGNLSLTLSKDTTRLFGFDDRPMKRTMQTTNGVVKVSTCNMILTGSVITPLNEGVRNVSMTLSGPDNRQTLTDSLGNYALTASRGNYTLTPFKNNEKLKLNGLSTMDLAIIQSHVVFRQRLGDPYKVIAADVNSSSSVTTADLMYIRRLLLQMDTSLPGNQTWAFVDAEQTFPNANSPFPIKQTKSFSNPFGPITHTFRAIKLGDVNYDRDPRLDQSMGSDTLKLTAVIKELPGLKYRILVKTNAINDVMGFQGTISWDNSSLSLLQVNANPLDMGIGEKATKEGKLLFSWNDPKAIGVSFNKGTTLLDITLQGKNSLTKPAISLTDDILAREAFNASFQKININLNVPELLDDATRNGILRLYPNPVKHNVTADWRSTQTGPATLKLLDPGGRTVWSMPLQQNEGLNRQSISIPKGIANGNYILRLESNNLRLSGTVVVQR